MEAARRLATGPQAGRVIPMMFLTLSLLVAGFGAWKAYAAQRSHLATATGVLTDYGEFAAWGFQNQYHHLLVTATTAPFTDVFRDRTAATGPDAGRLLPAMLELEDECDCGHEVVGGFSFVTRLSEDPEAADWAGEAPPASERIPLLEAVRHRARDGHEKGMAFGILHLESGAEVPRSIAYTVVERPNCQVPPAELVVFGVEVDRAKLARLGWHALQDKALLPPSLGGARDNQGVIQVEVLSPGGQTLFASQEGLVHTYPAEVELEGAHLGGGIIRASVLPGMADELIIGGLPHDQMPLLLLTFAVACALAVLALAQLRRESRLALLRQDFVASVSHELRTPLAQVRLFTETLRLGRTSNEEEASWALGNIDRETRRLSHLVENILHFSRAERGQRPSGRDPVDIAHEVREALTSFEPLVPEGKASFVCDLQEGLLVEANRDSFRQILLNFLDNAVRYGAAGQTVRITSGRVGDGVRIAVEDEGPGVPEAERDRIFEPFQRGERSVGTVVVGSGIGLSVVRDLVDAHDGRAWVEDAPGGGARFVVELPALHTAESRHFRDADSDSTQPGEAPEAVA